MRETPWPDLRRPLALSPLRGKAPQATQGVFHWPGKLSDSVPLHSTGQAP